VARHTRDIRDERTDVVQRVVDEALDHPGKRNEIARVLFGGQPVTGPAGDWSVPSAFGERLAVAQCAAAAVAAKTQLRKHRVEHLATGLREHPRASIVWNPPEEPLPPAPLLWSLVDGDTLRVAITLAAYVYSPHTAKLFDDDITRKLLRRLNAFARLEIALWRFAAKGGHLEPPPYAVRFYLARWFWDPSVSGAIFCLRCGEPIEYLRHERTGNKRIGRCRTCSRGREDNWPDHALDPYRRGTWLLRCATPGCNEVFAGRRQARHCQSHRLNRLAHSKRDRVPSQACP
jgi:hypothetical protein